jgi:HNH endonuclease
MEMDLFGEIRVVEGYDPDDEPGPFGISFNELKEWVACNPRKGIAWRIKDSGKARVGDLLSVWPRVGRARLELSQIIWVFTHNGRWAEALVDHKDGNRANSQIGNLREADRSQKFN